MPEYVIYLILVASGVILALASVFVGGWLVFKGKSILPNERFIGPAPKGEVFSITDDLDEAEFLGAVEPSKDEKRILAKTNEFLGKLSATKTT